ncbi:hypothetical protein L195_g002935 [Trifolium pratense]|uniref:Uncharacterized protein n=1 Tax=Trifolium pratense TaxID=57577 RepID=A0A2K3NTV3_TRIPR|nr:hypothetical protein L195_g002935 [Trifolium pratense]
MVSMMRSETAMVVIGFRYGGEGIASHVSTPTFQSSFGELVWWFEVSWKMRFWGLMKCEGVAIHGRELKTSVKLSDVFGWNGSIWFYFLRFKFDGGCLFVIQWLKLSDVGCCVQFELCWISCVLVGKLTHFITKQNFDNESYFSSTTFTSRAAPSSILNSPYTFPIPVDVGGPHGMPLHTLKIEGWPGAQGSHYCVSCTLSSVDATQVKQNS